ncbi:MOSC domain-containing protein [Robertmurraya kyonggiensis]|uniref:MOSC domain-containing protein n=1 Tax=Robertmurraya kyonggiensis TaxID=1037680 RepID=A0A4V5P487_9BACI|nr:MOSC domain-containing protein [Robertmurraya kyonggiensis]TKC19510.1 MOSC domain-containing protein [Robertmurraya kyonggiensis]
MKTLISLNVGEPKEYLFNGKAEKTGIGKKPITSVALHKIGFDHDAVASTEYHGGVDRAVCLYPYEHYGMWEKEFNIKLPLPAFGENLTTTGMLEKDVYIGDTFEIGTTVIQVTQGRIPCAKISKYNGVDLLSRIVESCYTGYLFRVLKEGVIDADSSIELVERVQEKYSVLKANQIMLHDRKNAEAIEEMLQIEELATVWKNKLDNMLEKIK